MEKGQYPQGAREHCQTVPFMSIHAVRTRTDMLRFAIAFALRKARKIVRGLRQGLTEQERYAVADDVVRRLQERGDPWKLSEELPHSAGEVHHSTPPGWSGPKSKPTDDLGHDKENEECSPIQEALRRGMTPAGICS
jgi:hypothetical protein